MRSPASPSFPSPAIKTPSPISPSDYYNSKGPSRLARILTNLDLERESACPPSEKVAGIWWRNPERILREIWRKMGEGTIGIAFAQPRLPPPGPPRQSLTVSRAGRLRRHETR